jgi:hypothetical protein
MCLWFAFDTVNGRTGTEKENKSVTDRFNKLPAGDKWQRKRKYRIFIKEWQDQRLALKKTKLRKKNKMLYCTKKTQRI